MATGADNTASHRFREEVASPSDQHPSAYRGGGSTTKSAGVAPRGVPFTDPIRKVRITRLRVTTFQLLSHRSGKEKANEKNNHFFVNARGIDEYCYGRGVGIKSTL